MASVTEFTLAIEEEFTRAINEGLHYVDILSKDLHIKVGGYPSKNHSMPSCCYVMWDKMKRNDEVLYSPPKGKGARLKIRYYL